MNGEGGEVDGVLVVEGGGSSQVLALLRGLEEGEAQCLPWSALPSVGSQGGGPEVGG